jgi:hypothetical protein
MKLRFLENIYLSVEVCLLENNSNTEVYLFQNIFK